jgi:predicted nucleotidyltransferase
LKANPNILECLYTPIVEHKTEVSEALLARRSIFLSKLAYQTYNGYVMSQFKRLEQDLRTKPTLDWKHAMHLIRLLLQGIWVLKEEVVVVGVEHYRAELLSIRDGQTSWAEINKWRLQLHREFDEAYKTTKLPDAPNYAEANQILVWARSKMVALSANS